MIDDDRLISELALPVGGRLGGISGPRRKAAILEAIGWPRGPDGLHQLVTDVYSATGGYRVCLGKPGKEAAPGYARPNPNDMTPRVFKNDILVPYTPTFTTLFDEFQNLGVHVSSTAEAKERGLQVMGCLLFRSAFMLDHVESRPGSGHWRYSPPAYSLTVLAQDVPTVSDHHLPVDVFLHLVDALAWNEDVKYNPGPAALAGKGRQNTLLTCVNIIAVFLGGVSIARFAGGMMRGVSPIAQVKAKECFPYLMGIPGWGAD